MLEVNQILSVSNLLSFAINCKNYDITINNSVFETNDENNEDTCTIIFKRKLHSTDLKNLSSYFNVLIRDSYLKYELKVNNNVASLKLMDLKNFDELCKENEYFETHLKSYNNTITNNINLYFDWLKGTLWQTDTTLERWTFYYKSLKNDHLGFADEVLEKTECIKISVDNFDSVDLFELYNRTYNITGTELDAKIVAYRRNRNSKYYSNWRYCKIFTPLNDLFQLTI